MAAMEGLTGNTDEMAAGIAAATALADKLRSPILHLYTAELSIEHAFAKGDWESGIAIGEAAIDEARSLNQWTLLPRLLVWSSLIYLGRGAVERAKTLIDEAWLVSRADDNETGVALDIHAVVPAHIGRAAYHLTLGETAEAIRVGEAGLAIADRTGYVLWGIHRLLPIVAEAYIRAGELHEAERLGARLRGYSEKAGHDLGLAWADCCDGLIAWLRGDNELGASLLREAAESLEAIPVLPDAARVRRQLAGRLAEIGDTDGALRELRSVHEIFTHLGAAGELQKAREMFGELGAEPPSL